jgi:hypothetical protein
MRIAVYVPDKGNNGESGAEAQEKIVDYLCNKLGGCTVYPAFGCWKDSAGEIVREPVHIVESYSADPQAPNVAYFSAVTVKYELSQDAAAYAIDGTMFLV